MMKTVAWTPLRRILAGDRGTGGSGMLKRRGRLLTVAALASVALGGCGSSSTASTSMSSTASTSTSGFTLVTPGVLTVGVYGSYPPAVAYGSSNLSSLGGIDGIWINAFAREHHLRLVLEPTTLASIVLGIQEHKMDVGLYFYYSPARSKQVFFTQSFENDVNELVVKKSFTYTGPTSVSSVATGVGFALVPTLQKALGSRLHEYPTDAAMEQAVLNGQVTGAVIGGVTGYVITPPMTSATGKTIALQPGTWGLTSAQLSTHDYNIVSCTDHGLGAALDSTLAQLISNGTWKSSLEQLGVTPYTPTAALPAQGC